MGVVYDACQPSGDHVALKLLYRETMTDAYAVRRFVDEAIAGSIIHHPNVVSVYERGETQDGIPYLVMERVHGDRLGARIDGEGPFDLRRAAAIVRQILDGLAAMHHAGIVHGDVKTDNVLIQTLPDGTEHVKLIDLGLAHVQLDESEPGEAEQELVSGTPDYMAPEVVRGEGSSSHSDVYAAGVILYELITGSTPFAGGSSGEILERQLEEDVIPPSLRVTDGSIPPILERIVMRALEKEPAKRFPSAAAFASALGVAMPCLETAPPRAPITQRFSTVADTLDWRPSERRSRRAARGTPGRYHHDRSRRRR